MQIAQMVKITAIITQLTDRVWTTTSGRNFNKRSSYSSI